jgi:hypothetical protein
MEQPDHPEGGVEQVDRDAVGNRYGKKEPCVTGEMPIRVLGYPEARVITLMFQDPGSVQLAGYYAGMECRQGGGEGLPASQAFRGRPGIPCQAEIERFGRIAAAGDTRHDSEPLAPRDQFEPGDVARDDRLIHPGG